MRKYLCMIGLHDFARWVEGKIKKQALYLGTPSGEAWTVIGQARVCNHCGIKQIRQIRSISAE